MVYFNNNIYLQIFIYNFFIILGWRFQNFYFIILNFRLFQFKNTKRYLIILFFKKKKNEK